MNKTASITGVIHTRELLATEQKVIGQVNDWLASHLSILFGLVWTIWIFISVPLIALLLPSSIQSKIFYLASGWIQLWALPLFVYVGNKLQRTTDAQSEAMHRSLLHISNIQDGNNAIIRDMEQLIKTNNQLLLDMHDLMAATKKDDTIMKT